MVEEVYALVPEAFRQLRSAVACELGGSGAGLEGILALRLTKRRPSSLNTCAESNCTT